MCRNVHYAMELKNYAVMCSDEMGVDIFFLFVKLTTLEGGIQLLAEYCPSLVFLALSALEKTRSDDFRTNSLGTLSNPAELASSALRDTI